MAIDLGSTFKELIDAINAKAETGSQGDKGDKGDQGIQGYGIVASVSRTSFPEANWTTYGTTDHTETWKDTSNIRNGCRVGDLFLVIGTATDTGNAHMAVYRSTTASGNLVGTCIGHYIALRGATGAQGEQGTNGTDGKDGRGITSVSRAEVQYSKSVTDFIIKYTDGTESNISIPNGSTPRVRGDWASSMIYLTLDIVYYAETGCAYIAKETTSTVPTDTDYWQVISAKGDKGNDGTNGKDGTTPTIKVAQGSHINEVGTPTVTASTSGTTTTFTFDYLKGEKGADGSGGGSSSSGGYLHHITCVGANVTSGEGKVGGTMSFVVKMDIATEQTFNDVSNYCHYKGATYYDTSVYIPCNGTGVDSDGNTVYAYGFGLHYNGALAVYGVYFASDYSTPLSTTYYITPIYTTDTVVPL